MENIKKIARDFLVECNFNRLQITFDDLSTLCKRLNYRLNTYTDGAELIKTFQLEVYTSKKSFSVVCDGMYQIFYDDTISYSDKLVTIAHEIGHIHLKHSCYGIFGLAEDQKVSDVQEREAHVFAYEFLAPPCVLKKCHAATVKQLKYLTLLDSHHVWRIHSELSGHTPMPDEDKLLTQYGMFVSTYNHRRHNFTGIFAGCLVVMLTTTICLGLVSKYQVQQNKFMISAPSRDIPVEAIDRWSVPTPRPSTATATTNTTEPSAEMLVYVTKSGTKYHLQGCYHLSNSVNIKETTISDAIQLGYEPCKTCKPDDK